MEDLTGSAVAVLGDLATARKLKKLPEQLELVYSCKNCEMKSDPLLMSLLAMHNRKFVRRNHKAQRLLKERLTERTSDRQADRQGQSKLR